MQEEPASLSKGNVVEQIEAASVTEINKRREYLECIMAVTCFLGKQGIAFRGHDETDESHNKGNFLEYTQPLQTPRASHLNEMIECCSQELTENIISEIKGANMYAIMADVARDGKTEQLALCVRYVSVEGAVKERFLALTEVSQFDATSITAAIENQLVKKGIDQLKCVAQTYDGAAVMSGDHPEAIYVHCYAHELNLVLCQTCKAVSEATEFFNMLESLHSFFSVSLLNHRKFIDTQKKLGLQPRELVQLSTTRWACQLHSVTAVIDNFPAIIDNFPAITECLSTIKTPTAVGLRAKLSKFSSVYLLMVFHTLLSVTAGLHRYLQKETIDIAQAVTYKNAVTDTMKQKRSDTTAADLYSRTKAMCEENQIAVLESSSGQRRKTKRMDEYVVDPTSGHFLSEPHLTTLALHYHIGLNSEEVIVAKNFLKRKSEAGTVQDMLAVYRLLDSEMFPSLKAVMQVALTIPVSSCTCERSFSALRRLHTWLRRTPGQSRLQHLAVMSIEKELLENIEHQRVIDRFATIKVRRHRLTLPK
uniref:Zinc finger MYM-type protein 1 n=1 Tax=Dicentrarchus labrax TaxID=13489 RepID=A0A8P4KMU2_DICLA